MKRALLLVSLMLTALIAGRAQAFYDVESIQTIELFFPFSNWDAQLDAAKAGDDGYIIATKCLINGEQYDSVGVKYKGNSSYQPNNTKNPFHIELTTVIPTQDLKGSNDIKLGNGFTDPSMIREVLSYEILRNYMKAPRSNFAKVYVNGQYLGLYSNDEHIGKKFATRNFYSNHQAFFKCNPASIGGPNGGASDLTYLGPNPSSYYNRYELSSDFLSDWQELINLCDTLNNTPQALDHILDVDRAIWMLAFNNVVINLDSYSGAFRQNYYLYRDDNGRFCPIVWDLNQSFGSFSLLGGAPGPPSPLDTTAMKNLALSANSTSAIHPLIQKIWNNPMYRRMYIAHAKTMVEEMFATGWYYTRAQELQAIIEADVLADNNKFFSNAQFYSSLTTNIPGGPGGSFIPGIKNLMQGRVNYLMNTPEFTALAPTISGIELSNPAPQVFGTIWITATITDATQAWLGRRYATPGAFARLPMFDDGMHNDGAAGDQVYGAQLPLQSARIEYYIYAENSQAGKFSPVRAEHEFYVIEAAVPQVQSGQVVINEFVADNETGATDPNDQYEDWIEVYNNTTMPISLKGLHLSDDANDDTQWKFPDWTVIPPNGYLGIWCDEDNGQSGLHANFKLDKEGGLVQLAYSETQILDGVGYTFQDNDASVARCENGTGDFTPNIIPTFAAFNTCFTVGVDEPIDGTPEVLIYPNPASTVLHVSSELPIKTIEIFDFSGRKIYSREVFQVHEIQIDTGHFIPGLYVVRINGIWAKKIIVW
ncbi:MAG: CotH kinase family protein [Saprospirales bacterium]|nr:CotH kinase family protein [Saprospirales bacterium]